MQLELGLEQRVLLRELRVVQQILNGRVDGIEEPIDNHLIHVVYVGLPCVAVWLGFEELLVLLEKGVDLGTAGLDLRVSVSIGKGI